jgi:ABC-type lipoprotein export system ATPase subunit
LTDDENLRNPAAITHANEIQEQRNESRQANALRQRLTRQQVTETFRTREQQRLQVYRALTRASLLRFAFEYVSDIDYSSHSQIVIGAMNIQCQHCHALKNTGDLAVICFASGKAVLPPLNSLPELIKSTIF